MKTLEELKSLKEELEAAYNTVVSSDTAYDQATILYAKKCFDDANRLYRIKVIENEDILIEKLNLTKHIEDAVKAYIECPVVKAQEKE